MYDYYLTDKDERDLKNTTDRLIAHYDVWGIRMYELTPAHSGQKSFGGRAYVVCTPESDTLISYCTPIIRYDAANKSMTKLWNDWSATTSKHIHEFLAQHGLPAPGKAQWLALPCNEAIDIKAFIED